MRIPRQLLSIEPGAWKITGVANELAGAIDVLQPIYAIVSGRWSVPLTCLDRQAILYAD